MEVGVCGADRNEGEVVGGHITLVDVNESLDAADGLCLHKAQANLRASTALRSVDVFLKNIQVSSFGHSSITW